MSANPKEFPDLGAVFDAHIEREFADQDVDATLKTMVPEPYVYCVPVATGAFGGQEVRRFYSEHFINQIPKDATVTPISRTIGKDQVVDEIIVSFTHNTQWDYLLPGIPPTGKHVELPHVVVMKFDNGKVAHEHVWWDQASLLVQVGLLDPANMPVAGAEQARELLRAAEGRGIEHAEAIAEAAVFLASDESKHITGQEFRVGVSPTARSHHQSPLVLSTNSGGKLE
jgi:carboxymethylenebutenolidase